MKGVGRVLEMILQSVLAPVHKLYHFFEYRRIIDIDNNGKGTYDSNLNNWTRILVFNFIYYDILKYTCNKEGSLVEFLTESPGHRILEGKTHHSSIFAFWALT